MANPGEPQGTFLAWPSATPTQFAYFDAVLKETISLESRATDHPVEKGADISDHIRPELNRISLSGFCSQKPIKSVNAPMDLIPVTLEQKRVVDPLLGTFLGSSGLAPFLGPNFERRIVTSPFTILSAQSPSGGKDLVQILLSLLDTLRLQGTLVDVVTSSRRYSNMILQKIDISADPDEGTGRTFDISLRELRTVESLTVAAPQPSVKAAATSPKSAKGDQAGKAPNAQQTVGAKGLDTIKAWFQ